MERRQIVLLLPNRYIFSYVLVFFLLFYVGSFILSLYNFELLSELLDISHQKVWLASTPNNLFIYVFSLFSFCILLLTASIGLKTRYQFSEWRLPVYSLLVLGILLRVCSWFSEPFSTDSYRYLSDGLNLLAGKNPYQDQVIVKDAAYPSYRTIYPWLAQIFFVLGSLLSDKRSIFQVLFGFTEICFTLWLLKTLIRLPDKVRNQKVLTREKFLLIFFLCLNPLSIFEVHREAHLEITSIALFVISAFYILMRRFTSASKSILAGLGSFACKFHGAILLPIVLFGRFRLKNRLQFKSLNNRVILFWVFFVGLAGLLTLLPFYLSNISEGQSGVRQYFKSWFFSHGIFFLFREFSNDTQFIIKILQRTILISGVLISIFWFWGIIRTHIYILSCISVFLLLFPVQHPWYYLLGIYGVLFCKKHRLFWMLLLSSIGLNYLAYLDLHSHVIAWLPWSFTSLLYSCGWFFTKAERKQFINSG